MTNEFTEEKRLPEFKKDLKKLKKKFRTIDEDLINLIKFSLKNFHFNGLDQGIVEIDDLGLSPQKFFKVRKFACRSLKGKGFKSGLRLIYKFDSNTDVLDLIEIYIKSDKENENRERIFNNYKKMR